MAYERGKLYLTYIKPNWGSFDCMRGLRIMNALSDAYDLCGKTTDEGETFELDEISPECKNMILQVLATFSADLTLLS